MWIAGVRVDVSYVRLLAQMLKGAGFDGTATTLSDALGVGASEVPLTIEDYEAILVALGPQCPPGLARLRTELLEEQRRWRRLGM